MRAKQPPPPLSSSPPFTATPKKNSRFSWHFIKKALYLHPISDYNRNNTHNMSETPRKMPFLRTKTGIINNQIDKNVKFCSFCEKIS